MIVTKLNLKLIRDLKFSPLVFLGITVLITVGIALFGASYELYMDLERSYALSYRKLNMADFTVQLQSAPGEVVNILRNIPGVRDVEGRTVEEVEIEQPAVESRKVIGRIISIPDAGEPRINQLKVIAGDYPRRDSSREVLLEANFAEYHKYRPGDRLRIVISGEKVWFRIAGVVQSPEYIYVVRSREHPMPSPRTFGVMWARKSIVDQLFGTSGSVNEVGVKMAFGGNRETAMRLASNVLKPYGADDPMPQEQQPSVEFLRLDLKGLQSLAIFFPILFLTISALSIYNLLGRMVHAQRSQIGFLRAVGFSKTAVGFHYVQYALLIGFVGGVSGAAAGHYLGNVVVRFYTSYIQVPYYDFTPKWGVAAGGMLFALSVTTIAGLVPALQAARLAPAQAIGVEIPVSGRAPIIERYLPFLRRLSLFSRLPLRNFLRNPRRTISTVAGVASAAVLLLVSAGLLDSSTASIEFYFKKSIHYDIFASYLHPQNEFVLQRIRRWKGVKRVEPVLTVPAKLVKGNKTQTTLIYGVGFSGRLMTLTDPDGRAIQLQPNGLMVGDYTMRKLGLHQGGTVRLTLPTKTIPETPLPTGPVTPSPLYMGLVTAGLPAPGMPASYRQQVFASSRALLETDVDKLLRITGVTYQPVGNAIFAPIDEVRRWYGPPLELPQKAFTDVAIKADSRYVDSIERALYRIDEIAAVQVIKQIEEDLQEMMEQSDIFFDAMLTFSIALAAVITFNSTLMNVIERSREIATLRTLGISVGAASRMVFAENLLAYVCGIILGLPLGLWLANKFVGVYESESFHMQTVIYSRTYWLTVIGILLTVALAQLPSIRYIRQIELAKATKDIG